MQPKATPPSPTRNDGNYAQSLLSRFNLPSARQGLAAPAGDFYGLLSSALATINTSNSTSREAQVEDLSRSGTLIPRNVSSNSDKMTFLSTQRERLSVLLSALDKEAIDLGTEAAIEKDVEKRMAGQQSGQPLSLGEGLRKSKSEAEFEEIGKDELGGEKAAKSGGSWMPTWSWGAKSGAEPRKEGSPTGVGAGR